MMLRFRFLLPLLLTALFNASCRDSEILNNSRAEMFKKKLLEEIERSDKIIVIEHSWREDFPVEGRPADWVIEYDRKILTSVKMNLFREKIAHMNSKAKTDFSLGLFSPHHSFEFFVNGKRSSRILVSFELGEMEWSALDELYPQDLLGILETVVVDVGLSPRKNWRAE